MAVNPIVVAFIRRRSFRAGRPKHAVASLTVENYVKTIALIAARNPEGSLVGTGELAQALNVSPGTVTGMLKTLSEANLATYTPYEGARLTESGQRLAMKVIRRHRLLERFLAETLTMSWDEVHEEAEHMEHAASERLIDRIDAYLGYPAVDPHGDPIPRADGSLARDRRGSAGSMPARPAFPRRPGHGPRPGLPPLSERMRPRASRRGRTAGKSSRGGRAGLQAGRAECRAGIGRGRQVDWSSSPPEDSSSPAAKQMRSGEPALRFLLRIPEPFARRLRLKGLWLSATMKWISESIQDLSHSYS